MRADRTAGQSDEAAAVRFDARSSLSLQGAPHPLLSREALDFLAALGGEFAPQVWALRARRGLLSREGRPFDFLSETAGVRAGHWVVAPLPSDLQDRRVEITGPTDRKMVINALNSGADVFMADFEDSTAPTWENLLTGQQNLFDAVRRTITFRSPETGKDYALVPRPAVLFVRPRGWHLDEAHVRLTEGQPLPASLFDLGLYLFHNARALLDRGSGPYFYLPKLEGHREARLWNQIFVWAQSQLGLPQRSIKATCLIETLPAAFEMDEILFELRDHSAGLNCGRWDYIFSYIKKQAQDPTKILPDRAQVTMDKDFLRAYSLLLIETCHRRGVHAMGGMAAQIPIKGDAAANAAALAKVKADKQREVDSGHDGTWVAHPGLVGVAREIFDAGMPEANQIARYRPSPAIGREELLRPTRGTRTEAGLRHNIRVGVQYLEAWLRGIGCVPLYNLMEDAATAEICRAQTWQWIHHAATIVDERGRSAPLTAERFTKIAAEELRGLEAELGPARFASGQFAAAQVLFTQLCTNSTFEEFLTLPAYRALLQREDGLAAQANAPELGSSGILGQPSAWTAGASA